MLVVILSMAVLRLYRFYNLRSRGIHIEDAEYYAYDEDDAARDMITIAGNYPKVKDENGHSYYMLVKKSVEDVASGNDSAGAGGGYGGAEDAVDYSDSGTDTGHSHNNDSGNSDWDSGSGGTVVTFSYGEVDGVGVSEIEME